MGEWKRRRINVKAGEIVDVCGLPWGFGGIKGKLSLRLGSHRGELIVDDSSSVLLTDDGLREIVDLSHGSLVVGEAAERGRIRARESEPRDER